MANYTKLVAFKLSEQEYKQAKVMAEIYANNSLSAWIRHCLENYTPKMLKKKRKRSKSLSSSV